MICGGKAHLEPPLTLQWSGTPPGVSTVTPHKGPPCPYTINGATMQPCGADYSALLCHLATDVSPGHPLTAFPRPPRPASIQRHGVTKVIIAVGNAAAVEADVLRVPGQLFDLGKLPVTRQHADVTGMIAATDWCSFAHRSCSFCSALETQRSRTRRPEFTVITQNRAYGARHTAQGEKGKKPLRARLAPCTVCLVPFPRWSAYSHGKLRLSQEAPACPDPAPAWRVSGSS